MKASQPCRSGSATSAPRTRHIVADERWSLGVLRASQQPPFIQRWRADLFELNIWLEVDGVRKSAMHGAWDRQESCPPRAKNFSLRSSLLISITPCPSE